MLLFSLVAHCVICQHTTDSITVSQSASLCSSINCYHRRIPAKICRFPHIGTGHQFGHNDSPVGLLQTALVNTHTVSSASRLQSVSTIKNHAMTSCASSEASNVAKDDDTDDDYFCFTDTDGTASNSNLSQTLQSATRLELEALNFNLIFLIF